MPVWYIVDVWHSHHETYESFADLPAHDKLPFDVMAITGELVKGNGS